MSRENTGKNEARILETEPETGDVADVLENLEVPGEGSVYIWRWDTDSASYAMLERVAAQDFDVWKLGERYGPGKYRIDVSDKRNRYVKRAVLRTVAALPAAARTPAAGPSGMAFDPLAMLLENARRAENTMSAVMVALIQSLAGRPAAGSGGPALGDLVAVMKEAREAAASTMPPHTTMLELFREGMTLGRELDGRGGNDDEPKSPTSYLPQVLGLLEKVIPQAPAPGQPSPGAIPAASVATAPASGGDPVSAFLSLYGPQIVAAASSGQDPTDFARLAVSLTPRGPMRKTLVQFVFATPEQRRALFQAGAPALLPHAAWIDRACDVARGMFSAGFPKPVAAAPTPVPAIPPTEPAAPAVPAVAGELEDDDAGDDDGCDDPECDDPACDNPDHYDGCDDPECDDPDCDDPEHFTDAASKAAAQVRASEGRPGRAYRAR